MYIRFQTRTGSGLFAEAADFRRELEDRSAPRRFRSEFYELYDWLCAATPVPPKEAYEDALSKFPRSWYKLVAAIHVRRAWRIAEMLSQRGRWIRPVRSEHPGVILFEDEVQIVVRPHRQHYCPASVRPGSGQSWNGDRTTIRYGDGLSKLQEGIR